MMLAVSAGAPTKLRQAFAAERMSDELEPSADGATDVEQRLSE
jgi:hypothetical protein